MRRVCVCERATLGQWRAVRRDYHRHTNGRVVHPPCRPGHAHHSVVTARVRLWYRTDGWLAGRVPTYPVDNGGGQTVVKCTNLCFRQGELNVALVFICFMLWGRRFLLPHISLSLVISLWRNQTCYRSVLGTTIPRNSGGVQGGCVCVHGVGKAGSPSSTFVTVAVASARAPEAGWSGGYRFPCYVTVKVSQRRKPRSGN